MQESKQGETVRADSGSESVREGAGPGQSAAELMTTPRGPRRRKPAKSGPSKRVRPDPKAEAERGGRGPAPHSGAELADLRMMLLGSPGEVLERIANGDPLGVREKVHEHLRTEALLFDADRVHLKALAHCARASVTNLNTEDMPDFVSDNVARAVRELLVQEEEAALDEEAGGAFAQLAQPLGLGPASVRAACAAFNARPAAERRAFNGLVIEGRELEELAQSWGCSPTELARRARRALLSALAQVRPCKSSEAFEKDARQ